MKLSTVTMILAIAFAFFCPVAATTTSTKMMIPAVPETMSTLALIEMPAFGLNSIVATMMEFNTTTTASTVIAPTLFRLADKVVRKTCLAAVVAIFIIIWGYVAAIEAIALFLGFAPTTIAFAMPLVCCLSWDYYWSNEEDDNNHDDNDDIEHDTDTTMNDTTCPRPVYAVHVETVADEEEDCTGVNQRDEYVEDDQYTNYPEDCCFEQDGEKVEHAAEEEEELKVDDNDYCDEEEEEYYDEHTQEDDERYEEEDIEEEEEEEEEEEFHEEDIEEEDNEYYCYEEEDCCHEEDIEENENSDEEASVETETRPPFQAGDLVRVTGGKHKGHTGHIFRPRGGKGLTWDISLDRPSCGQTIIYKPPHMLLRLD